ncbi:site-specific DNA-methyltransferase [Ruminococcus sp.]|uniref:site-specific DNA-methyltransferase n=1 Tax=Ruminococcus sp. TaxID=41978 RepID=UPI0025E82C11|nr:site-specific DNA-methyltransferase [Ruminococcus sp.]
MANLSQIKRNNMLDFLNKIKEQHNDDDSLIAIGQIMKELTSKKYGLVWEEHEEETDVKMKSLIPVFTEVPNREIKTVENSDQFHFLLEGDNLHSLILLEKTHRGKIDVIYIDPPYNRGKEDFVYDDAYIVEEDGFKHSKWLSFMSKRLEIAKNLLCRDGVIIINIDEHESAPLLMLLNEIFGEYNNLGEIIWNKQNPKGDSKGVSIMHETILCFAKNREAFLSSANVCKRKKPNAEAILKKAASLFKKLGKRAIPEDVLSAIKPFGYAESVKNDFYVTYDLELINKEFQNWLSKQRFSNGEKAYKFIDETGRVYRGVSMAWPNKKKAPDDYFIPLIHPVTKKPCPVPDRGWRNPPATMQLLLEQGKILFGEDEKKQPERKYFLDENMYENVPSIYENADSADDMLKEIGVEFDYPKPVSEAMFVCSCIKPDAKIFLDFFAGSGTTGHAILELNQQDGGNRKFILCTNNENGICDQVTYQRLKTVISGYRQDGSRYSDGLPANLMYYRTDFVKKESDELSEELLAHIHEMIQLEYGIKIDDKKYVIIMDDEEMDDFEQNFNSYSQLMSVFINQEVFLSSSQEAMLENINTFIIPDYYFDFELREAGEIW